MVYPFKEHDKQFWRTCILHPNGSTLKAWSKSIVEGEETILKEQEQGSGMPYIADLFVIAHETLKETNEDKQNQ